jgi:ribosomal protein S27E
MTTHQLDLLENALDSLAEALVKFEEGDAGDAKAYKFSVLHMAQFIELIFKHHIAQKHPLLLYKDPFSPKLDRNKTIGMWEAVNFINNEATNTISKAFHADLNWLKGLRNNIEHHRFTMDVPLARTTIGRIFRSLLKFLEGYSDVEVEEHIPAHTMQTFKQLSDEYEFRRIDAIREADKIEEVNTPSNDEADHVVRLDCPDCDNPTLVINKDSDSGFRCTYCGNEESDEIPVSCDICGVITTQDDIDVWEVGNGESESRCSHCSGRYLMDKDD